MNKLRQFLSAIFVKYRQLILYGIIGATSAGLDFIIYSTLCYSDVNYQIANIISTHCGIFCSFLLNRHFNFKVKDKFFKRFFSFYIIGLVGLALTWLLLFIFVEMMDMNELIAKLIAIFAVAIVQFILNKFITFKKTKKIEL
ncbi:MAG: GtrA family protein [Lentimicrobiaceae bacterium]|nr:GtrA family protein [Lentimicrobiaceae bacterium]